MTTPQTSTLILGLGNELVSDDGFGPAVAQACRAQFADRREVHVESAAAAGRTLGGSHQMDLLTTLELGRRVGQYLPRTIQLLVAEGKDLATIHEGLSPELAAAVPQAVKRVAAWIDSPSQA
jgi:Ni,Fe-hydrogenase maturation factor